MINPALIVEAIPALAVLVGALLYGGRVAGKIDANTSATERLTATMEKQSEKYDGKFDAHGAQLANHETRITVLESTKAK